MKNKKTSVIVERYFNNELTDSSIYNYVIHTDTKGKKFINCFNRKNYLTKNQNGQYVAKLHFSSVKKLKLNEILTGGQLMKG